MTTQQAKTIHQGGLERCTTCNGWRDAKHGNSCPGGCVNGDVALRWAERRISKSTMKGG